MTLQDITPDALVIGVLTPIPNPAIIKENECLSVPKKMGALWPYEDREVVILF